jgi:hypothetical protein
MYKRGYYNGGCGGGGTTGGGGGGGCRRGTQIISGSLRPIRSSQRRFASDILCVVLPAWLDLGNSYWIHNLQELKVILF